MPKVNNNTFELFNPQDLKEASIYKMLEKGLVEANLQIKECLVRKESSDSMIYVFTVDRLSDEYRIFIYTKISSQNSQNISVRFCIGESFGSDISETVFYCDGSVNENLKTQNGNNTTVLIHDFICENVKDMFTKFTENHGELIKRYESGLKEDDLEIILGKLLLEKVIGSSQFNQIFNQLKSATTHKDLLMCFSKTIIYNNFDKLMSKILYLNKVMHSRKNKEEVNFSLSSIFNLKSLKSE